jgi:RIO kinase 1
LDSKDHYEELYGDLDTDERPRRSRRKQRKHDNADRPGRARPAEQVQAATREITYEPSRYEQGWLLDSLDSFFEQHLISDVLYHVRGGKEASVYCCRADPTTDAQLLAAKVYRPRQFRSLRNDAIYREGRQLLTVQGRALLGDRGRAAQRPDARMLRAVAGKSRFGMELLHTSWLSYEFMFMERLYRAGAAVPKPYAIAGNAVLMSYVGDEDIAAPALIGVELDRDEAQALFDEVLRTVELMLAEGYIHGDLSAYNILYWEGRVVVIDFPQVTNSERNVHARAILQRDIERVCEYFRRYGVVCDADALVRALWARYVDARYEPT